MLRATLVRLLSDEAAAAAARGLSVPGNLTGILHSEVAYVYLQRAKAAVTVPWGPQWPHPIASYLPASTHGRHGAHGRRDGMPARRDPRRPGAAAARGRAPVLLIERTCQCDRHPGTLRSAGPPHGLRAQPGGPSGKRHPP